MATPDAFAQAASGDGESDEPVQAQSGPLTGFVESAGLFCRYPDFARCAAVSGLNIGAFSVMLTLVMPQVQSKIWGHQAALHNSWFISIRSVVGALGCPFFGRWGDKRGHRLAMAVTVLVGVILPTLALIVFGLTEHGLWLFMILNCLNAMTGTSHSGCPVIFALAADTLPPENRETGFGALFVVTACCIFLAQVVGFVLVFWVDLRATCWFAVALAFASLLGLVTVRSGQPHPSDYRDGAHVLSLLAPIRFVCRTRALLSLCAVASMLSFPDMAVIGFTSHYLFSVVGIVGQHGREQGSTLLLFHTYPILPMTVVLASVGVLCRRFGPAKILQCSIPVCAIAFASPALLALDPWSRDGHRDHAEDWLIFVTGLGMQIAFCCYIPLQALVAHAVPPSRVGEAMGAVAASKMLASIVAPLVCGTALTALQASEHLDFEWAIYPVGGVIVFCGLPFAMCLDRGRPRDGSNWTDWSSARSSSLATPSPF